MWGSSSGKKNAAAIRGLAPCHGSLAHHASSADSSCPGWGLGTLGPSHAQQGRRQQDVFDAGMQGQAVLALPLNGMDVSVKLPPGLQLAATPAGHLDCRMQLLGVQLDWPSAGADSAGGDTAVQPRVLPARSSAAGFACRSAALLLAHALFPDHTQHLLAWLAVPVAVADSVGIVAAATPAAARQAVGRKARQLKAQVQQQQGQQHDEGHRRSSIGWVDGVEGVVAGSLHTIRSLSGPAAALATGSWLWGLVSPSSHMVCSAVVALLAVAADYNKLGRDVARGVIPPGKDVEAAWRVRHKAAAQRLAVYCTDLPPSPPLAPLIHLASFCSIAAGLAFDGEGLCGQLPASLSSSCGGAAALLQARDWPLGGVGGGAGSSSSKHTAGAGGGLQLVLAGSVAGRAKEEVHEAAGLSRTQLLELFTGSTYDPLAATAAVVEEVPAAVEAPSAVCAGSSGGGEAVAAPASAEGRGAALRPSSDTASERSVDAVIHIKQQPACTSSSDSNRKPLQGASTGHSSSSSSSSNGSIGRSSGRMSDSSTSSSGSSSSNSDSSSNGSCGSHSSSGGGSSSSTVYHHQPPADPLAFLDDLPLYGQQDHTHVLAAEAAQTAAQATACADDADLSPGAAAGAGADSSAAVGVVTQPPGADDNSLALSIPEAASGRQGRFAEGLQLAIRGAYLLLVFAPFLLLGVPMLAVSWWLLTRAANLQHQQVTPPKTAASASSEDNHINSQAAGHPSADEDGSATTTITTTTSSNGRLGVLRARVQRVLVQHPSQLLEQFLQQMWWLLVMLFALLDIVLVLLLGGHWESGASAWESAGMWLRRQGWVLLHFSCSKAGAAFIKWGQWSSSRRDIFPADFCDALSVFHDRAPVHSYRHSRRQIKAALGVEVEALFDAFDPKPLASGSIAQVHRATLRPGPYKRYLLQQQHLHAGSAQHEQQQLQQVVVKVCHPNVAEHIRLDFKLVGALSVAASKLPLLRGLPVRETVAQFSHTMTAQTDLRVEAVHALRFHNNFAGVKSSVTIPRPIPGLVSSTVLVESYEEGASVAVFMKEPAAINTQIVALGVDAYLKMLLTDNFVHTDLHPGNILFRSVPVRQVSRKAAMQQQQRKQRPLWRRCLPGSSGQHAGGGVTGAEAAAAAVGVEEEEEMPQWERELLQLSAQQQRRWVHKHGSSPAAPTAASGASSSHSHSHSHAHQAVAATAPTGGGPPEAAQLVLLDFGLAEQLTATVRHHFISFLNAISAGDGLAAAHHLLRWSSHQTCPDRRAFGSDMVDLFHAACDIHSPEGIDLDYVMQQVLGLARKHSVAIDSCYASLVISVCVLVGFGKALDPEVNLMDAATPTLLAYALTGKAVGRLYS